MMYPVTSIFGPTLQGEGRWTGHRACFVRLAGCAVLKCSIRAECDEAPWKATETLSEDRIADRLLSLADGGIVVITGGEPAAMDLVPLSAALNSAGFRLHIETSGEFSLGELPLEWITVSPKTTEYKQRSGHALKIVVRPGWTWLEVRELDHGTQFLHRYLQPLTGPDGEALNRDEVVAMLTGAENRNGRWALSEQRHRVWGLQ